MVFTNLSQQEKQAFFAVLDEYFDSRPHLFGGGPVDVAASLNTPANRAVAASAVHNAMANTSPKDVASMANRWKQSSGSADTTSADDSASSSAGRVAAAAALFGRSGASASSSPPGRPSETNNPTSTSKKFGDVDMSSAKGMFGSLRNSTAAKTATPAPVAPPTPSAFQRKNTFAPPPVRQASPPPPAQPEGEIAEVLYDYSSEDPGDLEIKEGERVMIIEKPSDEWWMAEIAGRTGLVPASYVRVY